MTKTAKQARAEIDALIETAKADGASYTGVPVAELEMVLADLDKITPSEGGKALASGRKAEETPALTPKQEADIDEIVEEAKAAEKGKKK